MVVKIIIHKQQPRTKSNKNKKQPSRLGSTITVSSGNFFGKDKQNWSTWEHKEAVRVIHSVEESVNKQNIKVFTDKTFATTVAKDNTQSN